MFWGRYNILDDFSHGKHPANVGKPIKVSTNIIKKIYPLTKYRIILKNCKEYCWFFKRVAGLKNLSMNNYLRNHGHDLSANEVLELLDTNTRQGLDIKTD